MARTDSLTATIRGHRKALIFAGTALALAGAGSASAATVATSPAGAPAPAITASAHTVAEAREATPARSRPHSHPQHISARNGSARDGSAHNPGAHNPGAHNPGAHNPGAHNAASVRLTARPLGRHAVRAAAPVETWGGVSGALNRETNPAAAKRGELLPADKLLPAAVSSPQSWMPITSPQYANASTIVQQALARRMGVRSAVVAVATAMQESRLLNLNYGTSDSLGLFQQRPSMGWGTPAQVTDPAYAAGKFLGALRAYQAADPAWAMQPLWASAQAVQNSGFPYAYAQWETQAAHLVQSIAIRLT